MKLQITTIAMAGARALTASAQGNWGPGNPPPGGPGMDGHRPPPLPLVMALDVNHDGVIDANEIANASAELKTLDKNGDGQLTRDEFCPPPPARGNGNGDEPPGPPPNQQ
jgi:hypothetical protein